MTMNVWQVLYGIVNLGGKFALDDSGPGFSSLNLLQAKKLRFNGFQKPY
jgi:EAL domain-containing protein (putative c-di-GMP-specific phosphodiesterase class I)